MRSAHVGIPTRRLDLLGRVKLLLEVVDLLV